MGVVIELKRGEVQEIVLNNGMRRPHGAGFGHQLVSVGSMAKPRWLSLKESVDAFLRQ